MVLVGASLAQHWETRALLLASITFALIRPATSVLFLSSSPLSHAQRWLLAWFGVRGIGSLYYLSYALRHGLSGSEARLLSDLTISVVAISILVHGITAQPLLDHYEKTRRSIRQRFRRAAQ